MTLVLPQDKSAGTKFWIKQKFLMLGQSGIGKSEFWAQGDKTLFIHLEPRLEHLSLMKIPADHPVRNWDEVFEILKLLDASAASGQFGYDTIVVDTVDKLVSRINDSVIDWASDRYKKIEINGIGEVPEGVGWSKAAAFMATFLDKLNNYPAAKVLIGHTKTVVNEKTKEEKDTISIGGQMGTMILGWSDHTLHVRSRYSGDKIERMVRTLPTSSIEAKSSNGLVPDATVWTADSKANYANLRKLFD